MEHELTAYIDQQIKEHIHDGNLSQQIQFTNLLEYTESANVTSQTIATTGNTDTYFLAQRTMSISQVDVSATTALATSDTNFITFSVTNLGQDGTGTKAILVASDSNTTKTTGGSALVANAKRTLNLSATPANLEVVQGDRIRIRAAVSGTLANTVTFPVFLLQFN